MFWADRINKVAGTALIVLTGLIVLNFALMTTALGSGDPTDRGDVEGVLRHINDHQASYFLATASGIMSDAVVLVAAGAMLYLVFRDRSRVMGLFGFGGLLLAAAALLAADAANVTLGFLAADFVEKGGAGAIVSGDPAILETARAVGLFGALLEQVGSTAIAFGLLAFGTLIASAPRGAVNPPRWLGILPVTAGAALLLGWIAIANASVGDGIATIGYIGTPLWLLILGAWLLAQPDHQDKPATARPAAAPA
jgi:hypothetical protein